MVKLDYTFYTDVYGGSLVSEEDFPHFLIKATTYINYLTFNKSTTHKDKFETQINLAICEVVDLYYKQSQQENTLESNSSKGIKSETVKSHKVDFETLEVSSRSDLEASYDNLRCGVVYKHLLPTGLLYKGVKRV